MWFPRLHSRFWHIGIFLLSLMLPNYLEVELLELDGSNDSDSEVEALRSKNEAALEQVAQDEQIPLAPHHDATALPDPLAGLFSTLAGWTSAAKDHLSRGARTAELRAIAGVHPAPLIAFAPADTPAADPA